MSLEQFAEIVGLEPRHFQQVYDHTHFPIKPDQNDMWFQHSWQQSGRASREELASAIAQAEEMIATLLSYKPAPAWEEGEAHLWKSPSYVMDAMNLSSSPIPGRHDRILTRPKTVRADWGKFIVGGRRNTELLGSGVAIALDDHDGDGYDEEAEVTLTVADASDYAVEEIMLVATGDDPEVENAIRYLNVDISGNDLTITGNSAQFVLPELWERPDAIDGDDPDNYLDEVDVWRVYNSYEDVANAPVEFGYAYGTCSTTVNPPLFGISYGVLQQYISRGGVLSVIPASWDDTNDVWINGCCGREPQLMKLWYKAGQPLDRRGRVDGRFARSIAALATALISKYYHTYGPPNNLMEYWLTIPAEPTISQALCPWGPQNGAWEAYAALRYLVMGDIGMTSI
jgi:hypothetical protein